MQLFCYCGGVGDKELIENDGHLLSTVDEATPNDISISFTNRTNKTVEGNAQYVVSRNNNGVWEEAPFNSAELIPWLLPYGASSMGSFTVKYNFGEKYELLEPGSYRFTTIMDAEVALIEVTVYFYISFYIG